MKKLHYEIYAHIDTNAKDSNGNSYDIDPVDEAWRMKTVEFVIADNLDEDYVEGCIEDGISETIYEMQREFYEKYKVMLEDKFSLYFDEYGDWSDCIYTDWSTHNTPEYNEFMENVLVHDFEGPYTPVNDADIVREIK